MARKAVAEPGCTSATYNGSSQTLLAAKTSGEYTNSAITGTNAGSYSQTLTLNSNYQWSSGSNVTSNRTKTCTISKATPTITLSATSGTVVAGKTMTFTATVKSGTSTTVAGTLGASSGSTSYATISPTSTSITGADNSSGKATTETVTGVASGSSTITVTFTPTDTTNFNSASSKTYTATVTNSAAIPTNSLCVSRTYTGSAQQLTSATSGTGYTLSGYSQTNAGTYTITAIMSATLVIRTIGFTISQNLYEKSSITSP